MLEFNPPAAEASLSGARLVDGEVELSWSGQRATRRFSPFWLRDHCHSKHSLHPDTLQREVDTFSIPRGYRARAPRAGATAGGSCTSCGDTTAP